MIISKIEKQFNDTAITAAIKSKFFTDGRVPSLGIEVTTEDGVVKLSGDVNSEYALYSAVQIAYSTEGVLDVDSSQLQVVYDSKHPIEDGIITAKVKGLFLKEEFLGDLPLQLFTVEVSTTNNVVTLKGKVSNKLEAKEAERLARSVKGVKDVENALEY